MTASARGLLDLYEAGFEPRWLEWSLGLTEAAITRFGAPGGGLYQTGDGASAELFARAVEDHDGVANAGDYIWRIPGSLHENHSPNGAVLFAVYRKPNIYYHAAKETAGF